MTDPLDALRTPIRPVDPDPAFARALRTRVERALLDRPEVPPVTSTSTTTSTTSPVTRATVRPHALTPYLAVIDAQAAVEFYVLAFDAHRRNDPIVMPDGRVGHVEVAIGDSVLMLADEFPEMGLVAPLHRGGPSQSLRLEVSDPDAVVARAVAAGALLERPVTDSPYGRGGTVVDASGHRWMVSAGTPPARTGDVVYCSIWTPDVERAARFYSGVLGWELAGDHDGRGHQVQNLSAHLGLYPAERATTFLCFAVPDVDAAVTTVRAAGGTAEEPTDTPDGRTARCTDDQGIPFAVAQGSADDRGGPALASGPGGVEYLEIRVPDAGRARAFYGTVLGWGFVPGGADGYWHPTVAPGVFATPFVGLVGGLGGGLGGGPAEAVVVPAFGVPDIDAACAAVRTAGGTAREPASGRNGTGSHCTDDQGAPFALKQL